MPGKHASPFFWWMTATAWEAWGVIAIVYLAAFLAGIRPARWFGTRLLPLAAGGVLAALLRLPMFWPLLGDRGVSPGRRLPGRPDPLHRPDARFLMRRAAMSKPQGILRPLGLALVLAIGFGAVFAVAAAWGISIWEGLHQQSPSTRT